MTITHIPGTAPAAVDQEPLLYHSVEADGTFIGEFEQGIDANGDIIWYLPGTRTLADPEADPNHASFTQVVRGTNPTEERFVLLDAAAAGVEYDPAAHTTAADSWNPVTALNAGESLVAITVSPLNGATITRTDSALNTIPEAGFPANGSYGYADGNGMITGPIAVTAGQAVVAWGIRK